MPGAPFTVADSRDSVSTARTTPAALARTFDRRADEVPAARRFIRDTLADHPAARDAELLTCELMTNAVQHATDAVGVTVTVTRRGSAVHIDIVDDGRAGLPHWHQSDWDDERGRGFHLVNHIANRWGFHREQDSTCVWFEVEPPY